VECQLTPPRRGFHNSKRGRNPLKERHKSPERVVEEAVSRALRDNLAPLQRTAEELQQAYADLVAACSTNRSGNALPALLRAQTAASALAAGLSVLSNFVAVALSPHAESDRDADEALSEPAHAHAAIEVEEPAPTPSSQGAAPESGFQWAEETPAAEPESHPVQAEAEEEAVAEVPLPESPAFDISSLPPDLQDLHRRANRVAKVAMQDIKLLRPQDVRLGREHKDICIRLRSDLDKARKEYDRRFRAILDHPVDHFHHWLVEILAGGDSQALGEYPYPSPVLRH